MSVGPAPVALLACRVDPVTGAYAGPGREGCLTTTERGLLAYLCAHPHRTISRDELHREVWGHAPEVLSRVADVTMRRLRTKLERDPQQPRHLITVHGEGYRFEPLRGSAPAAPAASAALPDLPQPHGPLLGREALLAAVEARCQPGEVVCLLGGAGVGKSRLALEVARRAERALWVALDTARAGDGAALAVAAALALVLGEHGAEAAVVHALDAVPGPVLVVLDRAEHVAEDVARLVEGWRGQLPHVSWLISSQKGLGRPFERRVPVGPLADREAAARLYVERARAQHPDLAFAPEAVRALVERLEAVPLALILAASRAHVLGPEELVARLDRPLDILAVPGEGRHRSLRAALDASWSLLDPPARQALACCALFEGGFDLAGAEAVLPPAREPALDVVQALVDHSLVLAEAVDGRIRFRLLDVVREYAGPRNRGLREARERHARWAAKLCADREDPALWLSADRARRAALRRELANLALALDWALAAGEAELAAPIALATWAAYEHTGPYTPPEAALTRVLEAGTSQAWRWRLLEARASLRLRGGGAAGAAAGVEDAREAAALATSEPPALRARLLELLAYAGQAAAMPLDEVHALHAEAHALALDSGSPRALALALRGLADVRIDRGDLSAEELIHEGLGLVDPEADPRLYALFEATRGRLLDLQGRHEEAAEVALARHARHLALGDRENAVRGLYAAALALTRTEARERAGPLYEQVIDEAGRIGSGRMVVFARAGLGLLRFQTRDFEGAERALSAVLGRLRLRGEGAYEGQLLSLLAAVQSARGAQRRALRSATRALELVEHLQHPYSERLLAGRGALICARLGEPTTCAEWLARVEASPAAVPEADALAAGARAILARAEGREPAEADLALARQSSDPSLVDELAGLARG